MITSALLGFVSYVNRTAFLIDFIYALSDSSVLEEGKDSVNSVFITGIKISRETVHIVVSDHV